MIALMSFYNLFYESTNMSCIIIVEISLFVLIEICFMKYFIIGSLQLTKLFAADEAAAVTAGSKVWRQLGTVGAWVGARHMVSQQVLGSRIGNMPSRKLCMAEQATSQVVQVGHWCSYSRRS